MEEKIQRLLRRLAELEEILAQSEIYEDQKKYRLFMQEHAYLIQLKNKWEEKVQLSNQLTDNQELLKLEKEEFFQQTLKEDISLIENKIAKIDIDIENLLVPPDPNDHRPTILELRAGTGGDEAALFVGDCARMYKLYAELQNWRYELLSCAPSDLGGFKEYIMVVSGQNAHRFLQYEAGTHRVQRVPDTETQGRVHTSAITVAVLLEPDENSPIHLDEKDLRIDTFRSSGAGGQHVNTTDSAVRITHLPTGIAVAVQEERSQHKNKEKALRLLKAKIAEKEEQKKLEEVAGTRRSQVGTGDRSLKIRTYNFPQNRLTDHRINLTKYNLDQIMAGHLTDISAALVSHFHQQKLEQ